MADPVSITSLVLDASRVLSYLISYGRDLQSARTEPRKLSEELFALKGILEHLSAQIEETPPRSCSDTLNPDLLGNVLHSTRELLHSLLRDLEEPKTKFKRLGKRLEWPFTQKEFDKHLSRLERVKSWLLLVLVADNASLDRALHTEMGDLARSLREDLHIRSQERIQSANRDLFRWLAPVDPATVHLRAWRSREIGTGKWFIDGYFKDWLRRNSAQKKIIFLVGKSGAGKTTLFAQIFEELNSMSLPWPDLAHAYFYCTFGNAASQEPVNVLGSLVTQISSTIPEILHDILPLYDRIQRNQAHRHPVNLAALEDAIIKYSSGETQVVLLVDAINESVHAERLKISLLRLAHLSTNIRILVTSTLHMISPNHANVVNMNTESIQEDIEAFIHHRLDQDETLRNLTGCQKGEIRSTLTNDADGSFRWVQLSLDNLSGQRTARLIREALRKLPGTLRETYASILERIAPADWEFARRALFWTSFAYQPLTLAELSEAVVIDQDCTVLDDDMQLVAPQMLLQICQGLITEDELGRVSLAHSSVRDFLTSEWIRSSRVRYFSLNPSTANQIIRRQCLTYLCLDNFRSGYALSEELLWQRMDAHHFLEYAAQFWAVHGDSESCTFEDRDWQLVGRLFSTRQLQRRGNFGVWVQTLLPNVDIANIDATQPLYYAASFGLEQVVRAILDSNPDIDAPGGRTGASALFIACWRRNYKIADILVQAGANIDFTDENTGFSVRQLALEDGHVFPCYLT